MVRSQRVRTARAAGGQTVTRDGRQNPPCAKIIVRLRPVLQDELANGETQSALTTTHRGEVKLKLQTAKKCRNRTNTGEGFGGGKRQQKQQQQQQREGLPTTVFQVDTVLGPGDDTSEVYAAAASRLVDRAITGGKALLLIAGTPGSGRSHTLWGAPQHNSTAATPVAAAAAATGIEEQGLLSLALADLSRRWNCGNGSPFYYSSSAAAAAAAATTGSRRFPSSSSTPAVRHSPSAFAPPLAFRLCVAEVLPGDRETSLKKDEAGTAMSTSRAARDLLRVGPSSVVSSRPSTDGGGGDGDRDVEEKKAAASSSPSPPRRWALSARDALVGLTSSSFSASPPARSSFDRGGRRLSGGGARKSLAWMGMGRGQGGVAADAERSLLTSRVLAGVDEVSAEGIEEALALVREGLSKRRREGHLVISAKLVMARGNDACVGPTPEGITETGELVFIELGDCPNDGLPQTLRNVLSYLKIGRDHQESLRPQTSPASRSTRVAITGTTDALPIPKKQISGINNNNNSNSNVSADNPRKNDPLWALLSAFADPGPRAAGTLTPTTDTPVKGAAATAATAAATAATVAVTGTAAGGSRLSSRLSGGGRGAAAAAVATEGGVGAREVRSANASAAAPSDGPLVVSVVATLRSGDSCYRKDKALLEALAKSSRVRPDSWRKLPLGRILVSMPSFSWWPSHPGPASAAADGSAPAPAAAAAPSAPPLPSSEEVSLAMSNYSSSRSASSSLSNAYGEELPAATVAVCSSGGGAGGAGAGLPAAAEDDGSGSPTALKEAASVVAAEADGMDNSSAGDSVPGSSRGDGSMRHGAAVPEHLEEASFKGDDHGAGVLATGGQDGLPRRSQGGRRSGDGDGGGAGLLTIEGADEAADKDAAGGARAGQKDERRVSPPWDDSTLCLLGLTRDELIDRVLQAEKKSRHWKAQHALVERKMAALLASTESQKTGSKGDGSGGGGVGPPRVRPMVGGATGSPGSISPRPAGRGPERQTGCSPKEKKQSEGNGALTAVSPCGTSAGTSLDTTEEVNEVKGAQAREHHGGAEGEESGASCSDGKGEEKSQSTSLTPGTAAVDSNAPVKALPCSGGVSGGGLESMTVHDLIADHLPRSRIIVAADNGEPKDIDDSSPPQPLTFKERRAVFSSNNSVPVPPVATSLPWSIAVNTTAAAGKAAKPTPSSPRPSSPRAGTRTSPPFTAFSSSAVEAARQNLKRGKILSNRISTVATRSHGDAATTPGLLSFQEWEGGGDGEREGSCVSSDARSPPHAAVSVSSVSLSQGTSSAAVCALSPPPCTPPRPLHHRRTSAPSPPAPSPCSTADRHRTTPGSPGSASSSASGATGSRSGGKLSPSEEPSSSSPWSSSFSSPAPPSTASSPQLASPPSFPKPNAERRRARARSAESGNWTTASSLSMASSVLKSPAAAGTASAPEASASEAAAAGAVGVAGAMVAVTARLPPTAPSAAPRRSEPVPASTGAATSASPAATSGSSTPSFACWSGTALRQKSARLQHSPASASFASTASSLPSPLPAESDTGAASAAPRVAGKGQGTTGVHHTFGGKTTNEGFPSSEGFWACPPGEVALSRTSFRGGRSGGGGGGSGAGGRLEDDWKERSEGVGPWPLFEETREGKASPHEKRGIVAYSGAIGTGAVSNGQLSGGGAEKARTLAAAAATEAAADPEVSIGNISTMQASRLRALREKMERRYWPRGAASETAATAVATTAANHPLASNTGGASATFPEGPKSLDRPAYLGRRSSQALGVKPRGGRQEAAEQRSSTGAAVQAGQDDSGWPLRNLSHRM